MTSRVLRMLVHCLYSNLSNLILSTTLMKMFLSLLLSLLENITSPLSKQRSASIFWLTLSVLVPTSVWDHGWCRFLRSTAVCLCMDGATTQLLRIMLDLPVRICCRSYWKLCTARKCERSPLHILVDTISTGASFRMVLQMVQMFKEHCGMYVYGGCNDTIASNYARFACAHSLQIILEALHSSKV